MSQHGHGGNTPLLPKVSAEATHLPETSAGLQPCRRTHRSSRGRDTFAHRDYIHVRRSVEVLSPISELRRLMARATLRPDWGATGGGEDAEAASSAGRGIHDYVATSPASRRGRSRSAKLRSACTLISAARSTLDRVPVRARTVHPRTFRRQYLDEKWPGNPTIGANRKRFAGPHCAD